MSTIFDAQGLLLGQAHVGLVHQGSSLQGMVRPLLAEMIASCAAQLLVYQGEDSFECLGLSTAQPYEQFAKLPGRRRTQLGPPWTFTKAGRGRRIVKTQASFNCCLPNATGVVVLTPRASSVPSHGGSKEWT